MTPCLVPGLIGALKPTEEMRVVMALRQSAARYRLELLACGAEEDFVDRESLGA